MKPTACCLFNSPFNLSSSVSDQLDDATWDEVLRVIFFDTRYSGISRQLKISRETMSDSAQHALFLTPRGGSRLFKHPLTQCGPR